MAHEEALAEYVEAFQAGARWMQQHIDGQPGVALSANLHGALSDEVIVAAAEASVALTEPEIEAVAPATLADAMGLSEPESEPESTDTPAAVAEGVETPESEEAPVTEAEVEASSTADADETAAATA